MDEIIKKWQDKHTRLLEEYSKGNTNNEVMQLYRSQLKDMVDFINDLKVVKYKKHRELNDFMDFCSRIDPTYAKEFRLWIDDYLINKK